MSASASVLSLSFLFLISFGLVGLSHAASKCSVPTPLINIPIFPTDIDLLQFALNLEHMEADWFLYGALGYGLDAVAPELVMGGPPPIGATKANLDNLLAGLLAVESGQDAVIRTLLYERANEVVQPYKNLTVAEFTTKVSELRNKLASCGVKDEGLLVPVGWGAENKTNSNVLSANVNSVAYKRTPAEILRIVYGTGDEGTPGGFLPKGGDGAIARGLLKFA
uniref:Desiccation-related protein PCC13-62 n=1 Tax=Musa acuminata subsp. malaccensis TaxID=214687 RepID=A0A804L725_MUSAM